MRLAPRAALALRHGKLRQALQAAALDGIVVTHLPNLFYLTNFLGTAGIAVVTADHLYLIVDFRYLAAATELAQSESGAPGVRLVMVERSYDEALFGLLKELGLARVGVEGAHLSVQRAHRLAQTIDAALVDQRDERDQRPGAAHGGVGGPTIVVTEDIVERLRLIKDDHEIEMLRSGARLLSSVARDVLEEVKPGITEQELAAKIDWRIKSAGFERCSFETIVASGPNSALPHAHPGDRRLRQGDLVVLDFGGVYGGYCVDLTRTVAVGQADAEMERVYGAVLEAQTAAIQVAGPGVKASVIDGAAREVLARYGLAEAFGHSTGHGLGVEIHETPRIGPRRESDAGAQAPDDTIEPGMVFTIEPGAYLPGWGGVRIEDDVLVTAQGAEVLTRVPTQLQTHGFRRD